MEINAVHVNGLKLRISSNDFHILFSRFWAKNEISGV